MRGTGRSGLVRYKGNDYGVQNLNVSVNSFESYLRLQQDRQTDEKIRFWAVAKYISLPPTWECLILFPENPSQLARNEIKARYNSKRRDNPMQSEIYIYHRYNLCGIYL